MSDARHGLIARTITWCGLHPGLTIAASLALAVASFAAIRATPVDALPDISDRQVIVVGEWMGRSPALVEDQLTWPLASALLGMPGVRAVRGQSMPGMSFLYVVLEDDADLDLARARTGEVLAQVAEPLERHGLVARERVGGLRRLGERDDHRLVRRRERERHRAAHGARATRDDGLDHAGPLEVGEGLRGRGLEHAGRS